MFLYLSHIVKKTIAALKTNKKNLKIILQLPISYTMLAFSCLLKVMSPQFEKAILLTTTSFSEEQKITFKCSEKNVLDKTASP